jgi:hypothetical protein
MYFSSVHFVITGYDISTAYFHPIMLLYVNNNKIQNDDFSIRLLNYTVKSRRGQSGLIQGFKHPSNTFKVQFLPNIVLRTVYSYSLHNK